MQELYTFPLLISIVSFAVATFFSPGPNNLMLLSSGLTFGFRRTVGHIMGIVVGFPLMVIAVGLGVGGVFELYPLLYDGLKVVGMGYLLWMAWHIANTKGDLADKQSTADRPFSFIQAALFQWVNPKAWIIAITATSTFTTKGEHLVAQIVVIATIYLLVALVTTITWTLGGELLKRFISSARSLKIFNVSMAILIVLSVLPFMFG